MIDRESLLSFGVRAIEGPENQPDDVKTARHSKGNAAGRSGKGGKLFFPSFVSVLCKCQYGPAEQHCGDQNDQDYFPENMFSLLFVRHDITSLRSERE